MNKDDAVALVKGPLGEEFRRFSASCAVPFFWGDPNGQDAEIENGSAFFLRWDNRAFVVTADHVYESYLQRRLISERVVCQLGTNLTIDPVDRLIDRRGRDPNNPSEPDKSEPDIATFLVTDEEIERSGKFAFTMPAFQPTPSKGVFFAGFPASARKKVRHAAYDLGIMSGLVVATSVSDRDISCHFDRECMIEAPEPPTRMGGMSGAFLAANVERSGLHFWQPAGVMYEFHDGFEIVKACRLDNNLLPDGRIRR